MDLRLRLGPLVVMALVVSAPAAVPAGPSAAVPVVGESVGSARVSGTVLVKIPGEKNFVQLEADRQIPIGSILNTRKGRVRITVALPGGELQSSDFYEGVFEVKQAESGLATMKLAGGNFAKCAGAAEAKVIRHLWGKVKGRFRTRGRHSAATVRGTIWVTTDRCDGTLTRVTRGKVAVRDFRRLKTIIVSAGERYLAKAP